MQGKCTTNIEVNKVGIEFIGKEIFKGKTVNDLCREIEKFEKRAVK